MHATRRQILALRLTTVFWVLVVTLCLLPSAFQEDTYASEPKGIWGRLANAGFENRPIRATLFFSGQARDGSTWYECTPSPNMCLYTVEPRDSRHLMWSASAANRDYAVNQMANAGLNVICMSSWGEDSLSCDVGWSHAAPMQCAPKSHDELFEAATGKDILIIPFIESRGDWKFRDEFPHLVNESVAPGTVEQIVNLIDRYLKNANHPAWGKQWATVYDQLGQARYAVTIIQASSNRLKCSDHAAYADGFDRIAEEVLKMTGILVGFLIDPLPPETNAPGVFCPSPESTGPELVKTTSILGIQSFIPEIWVGKGPTTDELADWKGEYSRRWEASGVPFLMDISPGYDAHLVFPLSRKYGFTTGWRSSLLTMAGVYGQDGLVFNSWNGYTEGMAAVPTQEYGDTVFNWLEALCDAGYTYPGSSTASAHARMFRH